MKQKSLGAFAIVLLLILVGSFIGQSPKINGTVRNTHGIAQTVEKILGVAVVKADSTVAILDGSGTWVGEGWWNPYAYGACQNFHHGVTVSTEGSQPYHTWHCSDGYTISLAY